jgi:hypothetical protein
MHESSIQPFLFPQFFEGQELLEVLDAPGCCSGVILEKRTALIQSVVQALADGFGVQRIAAAYDISVYSVLGIRDRHPDLIAIEKKQLSNRLGRIVRLATERLEEALIKGEITPGQLPVLGAIMIDKKLLIDGEATSRIEHSSRREVTKEDVDRALQQLRQADVVEVEDVRQKALDDRPSESNSDANTQKPQQNGGES